MRAWTWLCAAGACAPAGPDAPGPSGEVPPLSADEVSDATQRLTALGPRMPGEDNEAAVEAAVLAMLREAGLEDVQAEPFVWDAWQPGAAALTVGGTVYPAEALSPSPTTTDLALTLVRADRGEVADNAGLYSSDDGSRAEQFIQALTGGAAAMIRITEDLDHDGGALVEVGHTLAGSQLPAVAVDAETGAVLRAQAGELVTLDITSNLLLDHTSTNVWGRIRGTGPGTVFVVAHSDSWHPSESAMDNALGVGALVGMARVLAAGATPERDIVFLVTSAEEQGLQGAGAWVQAHEAEVSQDGRFVLTLDLPWSHEGPFSCGSNDPGVADLAQEAAAARGLDMRSTELWPASDHLPFQTRGLDGLWCTRQPDRHYHTTEDTVDWLDFDEALPALEVSLAVLREEAGAPG